MVRLTDVEEIAGAVSSVTEALCGATFMSWDPLARGESLSGRMVMVALEGPRRIRIALACDRRGSCALATAVSGCSYDAVTPQQADQAIAHLLTVVADQVQRVLGIEQPTGAPCAITLADLGGPEIEDAVLLRSHGDVDIRLWIFEEQGTPEAATPASLSIRARFRSLVKRIKH